MTTLAPKYDTSCLEYLGAATPALRERVKGRRPWDVRDRQKWALTLTVDPRAMVWVNKRQRRYDKCDISRQREFIVLQVEYVLKSVAQELGVLGLEDMELHFELTKNTCVHAHGWFYTDVPDERHPIVLQHLHRKFEVELGRTLIERNPSPEWEEYCRKDAVTMMHTTMFPEAFNKERVNYLTRPFKADEFKCIRRPRRLDETQVKPAIYATRVGEQRQQRIIIDFFSD